MAKRKTQEEKDNMAIKDIKGVLAADISEKTKKMAINQILRRTTVTRSKQKKRTAGCDVDHKKPLKDIQEKLIRGEMTPEDAVAEAHKLGEKTMAENRGKKTNAD